MLHLVRNPPKLYFVFLHLWEPHQVFSFLQAVRLQRSGYLHLQEHQGNPWTRFIRNTNMGWIWMDTLFYLILKVLQKPC